MAYLTRHSTPGIGDVATDLTQNILRGVDVFAEVLERANRDLSVLMRPLHPIIDAQVSIPQVFKDQVKRAPIEALIGLFQPFEDIAFAAVDLANEMSGVPIRYVEFPPGTGRKTQVMATHQPVDDTLPPARRGFIRRLRLINQYMILSVQDPGTLANALSKVLADRGMDQARVLLDRNKEMIDRAAQNVRTMLSSVGINVPPPPAFLPNIELSRLLGLPYSGVGDGGAVSGPAAGATVTGATATICTIISQITGVTVPPLLVSIINLLVMAAQAVAGAAVVGLVGAGVTAGSAAILNVLKGGSTATAVKYDAKTGFPIDPATGQLIDPATGKPASARSIAKASGETDPLYWWVGGGVLAAAVAGGTAYYLWRKKR